MRNKPSSIEDIEELLMASKSINLGKKSNNQSNTKKLGITLAIVLCVSFSCWLYFWVSSIPVPPADLIAEINQQEVNKALSIVESINKTTSLNNKVRQDVGGMLDKILMYDSGQTSTINGYIEYNFPDKSLMGMLQRALTAASEEKIRILNSMKNAEETLESKLIISSNNPISKILKPAVKGNVDKATLNIYMNNGDPPVSLAVSLELLKVIGIADFSTYFLNYRGTSKTENTWLDDEFMQQFVAEYLVPVFYKMITNPYESSDREIPSNTKEVIALMLCDSWHNITPLTHIDMCNKDTQGNNNNESSPEGS